MRYVEEFLTHVSVVNAPTTHGYYRDRLDRFEAYRETHPGKLTRVYHNRYFMHLISAGLGRESISAHRATLHMFWEWCLDCGLAAENPIGRVALPPVRDKTKPIFTESEYHELVKTARRTPKAWWAEIIQMAWHTGLRMGDICMMQWSQIDFEERLIRIMPFKTKRFLKKLELPIADELGASLLLLDRTEKWVFPQASIHYRWDQHKHLSVMFARLAENVGCKFTSFHGLRRSFVTRLVNSGVNPPVICSLTGHSLKQLMTYVNVSLNKKREAIQTSA